MLGLFVLGTAAALAQISPEDHAKHHPGQVPAGGAAPQAMAPQSAAPMPGMGDMGKMMEGMGAPRPKELYPTLMTLPELTPQARDEIMRQAQERMRAGTALLSDGVDRLSQAALADDYAVMEQATKRMREGLARFESGLGARRALAEGQPPRRIALQWFRGEMNLLPRADSETGGSFAGLSWFHLASMVLLIGFAAVMIWMYFHKMRRAALLLQALTGGGAIPSAGPVSASPGPLPAAPGTPQKWSGKLRVSHVFDEASQVKTFRLMNPLGGVLPFSYFPGQFLTVTVDPDGKPVRRGYTIASSPTRQDYAEITVKHAEGGVVSGYLVDRVREGDLLDFSGPSGAFVFTGREASHIVLISAGVGITPLMSVTRYLTDRCWPGDIHFLFGCRTPADYIFRDELEYLGHRYPNLHVVVTMSHPEGTDWKGPKGHITKELIAEAVPDIAKRRAHICGPVPMMEAVKKMLADLGLPKEQIISEAFGPALGKPEPVPASRETASDGGAGTNLPTVTFSGSGKAGPLPPEKTVLDVADESGVDIDNSCRVGTCGACKVRLLSGQVTMAVEDALTPEDKAGGIILACQAKATGDLTVEA